MNENGKLILLEKIDDDIGFFQFKSKPVFIVKNNENLKSKEIVTNLIKLRSNLYISSFEEKNSFPSGSYNCIFYSGEEDERYLVFQRLCRLYSIEHKSLGFLDFFTSITELFAKVKLPIENLIGLFGELAFIKKTVEMEIYLPSKCWHSDNNTKYDFVFKDFNIDVKSTTRSKPTYMIKHDQIFNGDNNYIVCVQLINDNSGISISDLIESIRNDSYLKFDLDFQLKLSSLELNILNNKDYFSKFKVMKIDCFNSNQINFVSLISERVSNLTYDLDLVDLLPIDLKSLFFNRNN